jgi:ketosteroid isomerase-like protein
MMRNPVLILAAAAAACIPASAIAAAQPAAAASDPSKVVTSIIDKFNSGDVNGWVSAQEDNTLIIDDFGPHVWTGPASAKRWLSDYTKMAKAEGISGGRVDYGAPIASNADANSAYLVLPTTYRYVQNGTRMASTGSMTFVMKREGQGWKIASWTYSGATAVPEK